MKSKQEFENSSEQSVEDADAVLVEAPTNESGASATSSATSSSRAAAVLMGKNIKTAFGQGIVLDYREEDEFFVIKLTSGESFATVAMLYTKSVPERYETPSEKADALNVAYEALEKMRRMNLEVLCHEIGIYEDIDHEYCTTCLLANKGSEQSHFPRLQKLVDQAAATDLENFPRLHRLFHSGSNNGDKETKTDSGDGASNQSAPVEQTSEESSSIVPRDAPAAPPSTTAPAPTPAPIPLTQEQLLQKALAQTNAPKPQPARFPKLRNVWGAIQSIPQPVAPQNPGAVSAAPAISAVASPNQEISSKPHATASFPRIRGLLDSSGATEMFNSMSINASTSSDTESATTVESSTSFSRLRGVIDTAGASSLFGSLSVSQKHHAKPTPTKANQAGTSNTPKALPRIQKLIDQRHKANTSPCLICASPSCSAHSSASFRKEGITLCLQCEKLFELNFIIDCISAPDPVERANHIDHMVDCYDRCMLLLEYSSQFAEQIAKSLEEQKERQNKVGLASSSVGVLSGVLGIAAAASILTPAGPPLLIASLFFGGGATTIQTGTEALNYFSEPRKLADRVIALHGMALSLLRVTSTLRDAMMRDHIRTDVYVVEPTPLKEHVKEQIEKNRVAVLAGSNVGRSVALSGVAGVEATAGTAGAVAAGAASEMGAAGAAAGAAGARGATAISRAGTAAARTVRFARFAGGALSAAVLVMEANAIQSTLKSIHDGSPCDKANTLRRVVQEISDFPTSSELDAECQSYLEALAHLPPPPPVAEASAMPDNLPAESDIPEATCQEVTGEYQLCAPGAVIIDGDASDPQGHRGTSSFSTPRAMSSFLGGSSLLQRFQERQEHREQLAVSRTEEVLAVAVDDAQLPESTGISLVL
jgi:hypothetical protein